jgi:prefoldin subunit 5
MKPLFNLLKSSFTDKLAYASALVGALCWVIHARYPALLPGSLKASVHIYATIFAALTGGMLIAKYVLIEGYLRSTREIEAQKEAFASSIQRLEGEIREIRQERDNISGCESALRSKLKSLENGETASQLTSLRKKVRSHEEDEKTVLAFLLHELRGHVHELDSVDDREIVRAATVLKREIQLLEDEAKKGGRSLYELVLKLNEIRENIWDLTLIRLQAGDGQEESATSHRKPNEFRWVDSETDPSRLERIYKFLKVAFHPDRFSSTELKEEATAHFQEVVNAYTTLKERIRTH